MSRGFLVSVVGLRRPARGHLAAALLTLGVLVALEGRPVAVGGIHLYQHTLAPVAARLGARCRFTPTCSHYAATAIARDGLVHGGWKAIKRLGRCGPWTAVGARDEP